MKIIAAAILLLGATSAAACECVRSAVEDGLESSSRVFGAKVIKAEIDKWNVNIYISNYVAIKGDSKPFKKITTPLGEGACGLPISVPGSYVFFTGKDGSVDRCGASRAIDDPDLGDIARRVINKWADLKSD